MPKKKMSFLRSLYEFDGGGVGNAFTANVLGTTQLSQDPMKDEEEKKSDKEMKLRKELEDALMQDHEEPDDEDERSSDERVLSMLKNLLFNEKGYTDEDDDESEDHEGGYQDKPTNDPTEFTNGEELPNGGIDPTNSKKSADYTWNPKSKTVADNRSGPAEPEDKHAQLIAAIKELKDEIKRGRSRDEDFIEQEEDIEEDEGDETQYANATKMFQTLINQKMSRSQVIAAFEKNLGVTNSTAVSYYQRLAKDAGLTNSGNREMGAPPPGLGQAAGMDPAAATTGGEQAPMAPEESNVDGVEIQGDPNRQGLIRQVDGAHLVYKRKNEEGTYDELWVFGTGDELEDSLKVRRDILAGTDIAPRSTKSANGTQSYTLNTMGNAQVLHIKGLPN